MTLWIMSRLFFQSVFFLLRMRRVKLSRFKSETRKTREINASSLGQLVLTSQNLITDVSKNK